MPNNALGSWVTAESKYTMTLLSGSFHSNGGDRQGINKLYHTFKAKCYGNNRERGKADQDYGQRAWVILLNK